MARPRTYDDDLRRRLVDEAATLLATEGPHALTTRRVAAAAGTTTNALYTLVGGKAELVRAMYLEGFRRLESALAAVPDDDADPGARLVALGAAYFANAQANPHLYRVMFACPVPEFRPDDDDVAFALSTLQTQLDQVARCVEAGVVHGDPAAVGTELWAGLHGFASLAAEGMLDPADAWAGAERLLRAAVAGYGLAVTD